MKLISIWREHELRDEDRGQRAGVTPLGSVEARGRIIIRFLIGMYQTNVPHFNLSPLPKPEENTLSGYNFFLAEYFYAPNRINSKLMQQELGYMRIYIAFQFGEVPTYITTKTSVMAVRR